MNRMIFLIAPTGHGSDWAIDNARSFFNVPEKTFTFKFGFTLTLDLIGRIKPFNRIVETIKTLQSRFPEFFFVFCGWELIECLDELYEKFPDAEFFITTTRFGETKFQNFLRNKEYEISQMHIDNDGIRESTMHQFQKINNFLDGKEYSILLEDPAFSSIKFNNFQGIHVRNVSK
jgi:hypothetical protein